MVERLCEPFDIWSDPNALSLAIEARAYELLAILTQSIVQKQSFLNKRVRNKIEKTRSIIEFDLSKPLSLDKLADKVGLNTRSLTMYFRQMYGMSILEYAKDFRMTKGLNLLESGLSVSEAAYKVGYSLPYFSQQFRKKYGVAASSIKARQ